MGICLDTERADGTNDFEEETWTRNSPRNPEDMTGGMQPVHNDSEVEFEVPNVPVIFVLGGPGSGKVTHCDNLMQENKGITHINMTDLLQQYAIGNDMKDFGLLSSKTVTEVLMLEMKMAVKAKTYIISGYPRNMRDVVEYSEKIQTVSGAVLISWRQKILERQIDYGAKLGQVVLSLARMELNNFYKNVIPVAEYFDQNGLLLTINGERHPSEVYSDFKSSLFRILGQQDNPPVFSNGKVAPIPSDVSTELPTRQSFASIAQGKEAEREQTEVERPKTQIISVNANNAEAYSTPVKNGWPPVIWVIGGPGSNKAALCSQAARDTGWAHVSLGKFLRSAAEPPELPRSKEANRIKECITNGELVPLELVMKYVEANLSMNLMVPGVILDGFPRDMQQVTEFEAKFKQKPTMVLLDCSKLQLGRGRLDDSVTAFRRRLEIFRQSSLPMLKTMDQIGRLTIVDGDTDNSSVQEDFRNVIQGLVDYMKNDRKMEDVHSNGYTAFVPNGVVTNGHAIPPSDKPVETISQKVVNGAAHLSNGVAKEVSNGVSNGFANGVPNGIANGVANGIANGIPKNMANGISKGMTNGVAAIANGVANGISHQTNGYIPKMNGAKNAVKKIANNGLPSYTSLANDRHSNHSEINYMDAHI
ncbi:adenylate kinase isoenzyme 5 [Harmonia axyridis]|uniref:adenylate kinase isoenzyme 5 n=1 Tax=Harmonia axyridis TaxID=115357 RepID=UPI001E2778B2|nr:adenylate kinase isoenzyme 5 [Harmonia axyridis]